MVKYFKRVFIAFSILINTLLGGKNNQTFSARNWQLKRDNKPNLVYIIDMVFFLKTSHCQDSWAKWTIINNSITQHDKKMGYGSRRVTYFNE